MDRINVRLDPRMREQLESVARAEGVSPSEVVRAALREHLETKRPQQSCLDLARQLGIIGSAKGLPADLSTNPVYMEGFGSDRTDSD